MPIDGHRTKRRRNIAENFNRLSRVHERYRQTDGRMMTYSEREREFTYAKNVRGRSRLCVDWLCTKLQECVNAWNSLYQLLRLTVRV